MKKSAYFPLPLLIGLILLVSCNSQKFDYASAYKFSYHNYAKNDKEHNLKELPESKSTIDISPVNPYGDDFQPSPPIVASIKEVPQVPNPAEKISSISKKLESPTRDVQSNESLVKEEDSKLTKKEEKRLERINKKIEKNAEADSSKNWAAITGFVVGLVSLLVAPLPLGIAAIIFSAIGLKSEKRGLAIAGLVCGIVSVVWGLLVISGTIVL